jgi:hypothetical protein
VNTYSFSSLDPGEYENNKNAIVGDPIIIKN